MKKSTSTHDEELWLKFLAADRNAFSQIYQMYVKDLFQFGLRITQDQDLLKDTLQELFVSLWQKKRTLHPVKHVQSYLMSSYRNLLYRKISQHQKTKMFSLEDFLNHTDENQAVDETSKELLSRELENKIAQLTQRQKEIIHLRYYQNISLPEIADIMNINYQSAANLLHRSIDKLKHIWNHESTEIIFVDNQ